MTPPRPLDYETRAASSYRLAPWVSRSARFMLLLLLSSGWLLPMYLGVTSLITSIWERIPGAMPSSFPHLHFAGQAFAVAFIWLTAVVLTWTAILLRRFWPIQK